MIKFSRSKFVFIIGTMFFTACTGASPAANFHLPEAENQVISNVHREKFYLNSDGQDLVSNAGIEFREFLRDVRISAPGLIVVRMKRGTTEAARILKAIATSDLQGNIKVEVLHSASADDKSPELTLELIHFAYKLADCAAIINPRKIDSTTLVSPGFGCSVERNRMLSLTNPLDWQQGRPSTPSFARQDAKAVKLFYDKAPRSFPPALK